MLPKLFHPARRHVWQNRFVSLRAEDPVLAVDAVLDQSAQRLPGSKDLRLFATQQKKADRRVRRDVEDDALDAQVCRVHLAGDRHARHADQRGGQAFGGERADRYRRGLLADYEISINSRPGSFRPTFPRSVCNRVRQVRSHLAELLAVL